MQKTTPVASDFGIQKAMELMRKLPFDNVPLVVQVVRATLESTRVDVPTIIKDAKEKRSKIARRIADLKAEIAEHEEEISARRQEISALEDDTAETKLVQERLEMAMSGDAPITAPGGGNGAGETKAKASVAAKASATAKANEDTTPGVPQPSTVDKTAPLRHGQAGQAGQAGTAGTLGRPTPRAAKRDLLADMQVPSPRATRSDRD